MFLRHSSKDRRELVALKKLLDDRSVGAIQFFLSSDEESIRSGRLWSAEIKKALDDAVLMFAFVSPDSLKAGWTYFEAGYGLAKLDRVIPFCLPGVERGALPTPLSLFQAKNLHSAKDLSVLIRECNNLFKMKIREDFQKQEFDQIFGQHQEWEVEPAFDWLSVARWLTVETKAKIGLAGVFSKACREKRLECNTSGVGGEYSDDDKVIATGIRLTTENPAAHERWERRRRRELRPWHARSTDDEQDEPLPEPGPVLYSFDLAPQSISTTFPVLDRWKDRIGLTDPFEVTITFSQDVQLEGEPYQLTSRIFGSAVSMRSNGNYRYGHIEFALGSRDDSHVGNDPSKIFAELKFKWSEKLTNLPLGELVATLVRLGVLRRRRVPQRKSR